MKYVLFHNFIVSYSLLRSHSFHLLDFKAATLLGRLGLRAAMSVKDTVQRKLEEKSVCTSPTTNELPAVMETNSTKKVDIFPFVNDYSYVGDNATDLHRR
jgi:hypothetical protein